MPYKKQKALFSVIIPAFNRADYLKRAIESVIAQTCRDWELIVIDDGSTDETPALLREYKKKLGGRFRYLRQKQSGAALARNAGAKLAHGKFLNFLDSDDEYLPGHLEAHQRALAADKNLKVVRSRSKIIGSPYVPDKNNPAKMIHLKYCRVAGGLNIAKNFFNSLGGFPNTFFEDAALFDKIDQSGENIPLLSKITYIYHRTKKSKTIIAKHMEYNLTKKKCVPCEGGMPPLAKIEAEKYLKETPGWTIVEEGKKIKRPFSFKNFKEAMNFVNEVAALAQSEGHHPDMYIFYNSVTLELSTHAIGGLSENDFILAAKINKIANLQ